jgi:hypothetical protein
MSKTGMLLAVWVVIVLALGVWMLLTYHVPGCGACAI